jgi:hypothetical protein
MSEVEIGGRCYQLVFSPERQFVNGIEQTAVIDHDKREIRIAPPVCQIIDGAVSFARQTAPRAQRHSLPNAEADGLVRFSGCFLVRLKPWPWW